MCVLVEKGNRIGFDGFVIDFDMWVVVMFGGDILLLMSVEFDFLICFVKWLCCVFSCEMIFDFVYGCNVDLFDCFVDMFVL